MTLPAGAQTCALTVGRSLDLAGGEATILGLKVECRTPLVWAATGDVIEWPASSDGTVTILADQPGVLATVRDADGKPVMGEIRGWTLTAYWQVRGPGGVAYRERTFMAPQPGVTLDLDLLPATTVVEQATVTYAASGAYPVQQVTLTGHLAYTLPVGAPADQVISVVFTQDGTGGHTVTYGGSPVAVTATAGASTLVEFFHDGAAWEVRTTPASGDGWQSDKTVLTPVTADVTPAGGTVAGELIGYRNVSATAKLVAGFSVAAGAGIVLEWTGTSWARAADLPALMAAAVAHVWAFGQPDGPITAAVPSNDAALSLIPGDTTGLWVYAAGKLSSKTTTPGTVTWATARDSWTLQVDYSVASNMSCIYGGRSANGGAAGRVYHGVLIAGTSLAWFVSYGSALAKSDNATYTVPLAATLKLVTTKIDATHWTMEASINGTVIATCTFTATLAAYAYQGDLAHIMPGGNTNTACTADNLTLTV